VTFGSEGDTRPFVALAQGLVEAGHEVLLFAEQSSIEIARSRGISVEALAGDVKATLPLNDPMRELSTREVLTTLKNVRDLATDNTFAWMKAISEHARTADVVLFAGIAYYQGQAVAEALQKPGIGLWLQPVAPTREFASWAFPPMNTPQWLNRLSYAVSLPMMLKRSYAKSVKTARRALFGKSASDTQDGRQLTLYGISRHLVKQPADWPDNHQICGHWALPAGPWQAPDDLRQFLAAGPAPIYVGLGGASSFTRQRTIDKIISAVAGRRALFSPGWSKIDSSMLPNNFLVVGHTPHTWLFPQVSMVMHHCGAGTTHTAAQAGVPSVPLPLGGDQPHWANTLTKAGVAAHYMSRKKLDGPGLGAMIDFAERSDVREHAKLLAKAMSTENGVANAVEHVSRYMNVL
jgi:UDP:flavonoid glycosyltransferase YjiC (YdhE family)